MEKRFNWAGIQAKRVAKKYEFEKLRKEKESNVNNDTIERQKIHSEIIKYIEYGLKKRDVYKIINERFKDSKYKNFFEGWITDHYIKIKKQQEALANNNIEKGRDYE